MTKTNKYMGGGISILCLCTLAAVLSFGCGDDKNNEQKNGGNHENQCDCTTKANCSETELAACDQPQTLVCNCDTGANCSDAELQECSALQNECNCVTKANCNADELQECQQSGCNCETQENCNIQELSSCNASTCDCETQENCSSDDLAACDEANECDCERMKYCNAQELDACYQKPAQCDCATGVNCDVTQLEECKAQGECGVDGCAEGYTCLSKGCIEDSCIGIKCSYGLQCSGGECLDVACEGMECSDGRICKGGYCLAAACQNVSCPKGQYCDDSGKCAMIASAEISLQRFSDVSSVMTGTNQTLDYVFSLNAQPSDEVKVKVTLDKTDLIKINMPEFTITPDNWDQPRKISFSDAGYDMVGESMVINATFTCTSGDAAFNNATRSVGIQYINTNIARLIITRSKESIEENGTGVWLTVQLATRPKSNVRLHLESESTAENVVKFRPPSNQAADYTDDLWLEYNDNYLTWSRGLTALIVATENQVTNHYSYVDVKLTIETDDPDYKDLDTDPVRFLIIDDDKPQLIANWAKVYTEDDDVDTEVCLHLNRPDTKPVEVTMSIDTDEVDGDTRQSKVVSRNEDTCFKLHGKVDSIVDEDEEYHVTFTPKDNGGDFTPETATLVLDAINRNGNVADMDIRLFPNNFDHVLNENFGAFISCVSVTSIPSAPITVTATIPDEYKSEYILTSTSNTLDPEKMKTDQTKWGVCFGLAVINDKKASEDNPRQRSVTFKFTSDDPLYNGIEKTEYFLIKDDEGLYAYIEKDFSVLSESQSDESFDINVGLRFDPGKTVPIRLCSSDKKLVIHDPQDPSQTSRCVTFDYVCGTKLDKCDSAKLQVSPVDNLDKDGDKDVYLYISVPSLPKVRAEELEPITIKDDDSTSGNLLVECQNNNIIDCGSVFCKVSLMSPPSGEVTVDVEVESPNGFTLGSVNNLKFNSENWSKGTLFAVSYEKNTTHNKAFKKNTLIFTTHGSGKYNNSRTTLNFGFYPLCSEIYNSRVHGTDASGTGITLPPGSYRLQVEGGLGGGPKQFVVRGNGARGTYAEGVLKLTKATKVYPWVGYAGMSRYFYRAADDCDTEKYNCGEEGSGSMAPQSFGHDGGGASEIRIGTNDPYHSVIVGAGGNGAGNPYYYTPELAILFVLDDPNITSVSWAQGTTPTWKSYGAAMHRGQKIHNGDYYGYQFFTLIQGSGMGGGADGWDHGASGGYADWYAHTPVCSKWEGDRNCGTGAGGGTGFVWTEDTDVSRTPDYKLGKEYWLTEVRGWGGESTDSRNDYPDLGVTDEGDTADGVVKITALPRL